MISFVIPAYNASNYLARVVNSILGDGSLCDRFEILVVENGSKDNTTEIAEKLSVQYQNVHVFHSEKGVSNARNLGIENAQGEWIAFVDADDYLLPNGVEILLKDAVHTEYDMILYGHEAGVENRAVTNLEQGQVVFGDEIQNFRVEMLRNPTKYMQVWAKLFKKDMILKNGVSFDPKLRLSEDSDFTLQYSRVCKGMYISQNTIYHYSLDNVSAMRGNCDDKINDYILAMERSYEKIKDDGEDIQKAFQKYILMHLNIALVRDVFDASNTNSFMMKINRMKSVVKESVFSEAISQVRIKECMSLRMIPILCLKYHLYFASGCIYAFRVYMNTKREQK